VTMKNDGSEVVLAVTNTGTHSVQVDLANAYDGGRAHSFALAAGRTHHPRVMTARTGGWYDATLTVDGDPSFARVLAGRVETGRPATSDPQLGRQ
jgi:phospholipase C